MTRRSGGYCLHAGPYETVKCMYVRLHVWQIEMNAYCFMGLFIQKGEKTAISRRCLYALEINLKRIRQNVQSLHVKQLRTGQRLTNCHSGLYASDSVGFVTDSPFDHSGGTEPLM